MYVEKLQKDLDTFYQWQEETTNMLFNGKKYEVLMFGPNNPIKRSTSYFASNFEDIIEEKEKLRDLGIIKNKAKEQLDP